MQEFVVHVGAVTKEYGFAVGQPSDVGENAIKNRQADDKNGGDNAVKIIWL